MTPIALPLGVSVVIPAYNRPRQLCIAIESVRTCRPGLVEIVVADDNSTTDPREYLPEFNTSAVPIRCYRFERNRGPQAARNLGIRRARFAYIAFLDSDDAFTPDKIDAVLTEIEREPVDILFHAVGGMPKYNWLARRWHQTMRNVLPFHWLASLYNPAATPALVVRRRVRLGLTRLRHCEDWCFLLCYATPGMQVRYIDRELSTVFRTAGTPGGLSAAVWRMRRGEFSARAVLLKRPTVSSLIRYALGCVAGGLRIAGDIIRGRYWR